MIDKEKWQAFEQRLKDREDQWREYQDILAGDWLPLVRREMPLDLQKVLGNTFQMPIQVPHLRRAGNEWVALLTMTQAKTSTIPLESGLEAKKLIGRTETWLTAQFNRLNKGRVVDHVKSEGQTYHGVGAHRFTYDLPGEPDDDDLAEYLEPADEDGTQAEKYEKRLAQREKARDAYYADKMGDALGLKPVDPLTLMWGPNLSSPTDFIEKATISYETFKGITARDGRGMGLDELGRVYLLGQGENEEWERQVEDSARTFTYYRENVKDPKTGKWHCDEYVQADWGEKTSEYGELVNSYEIPFDYPEYIICPSGHEQMMEQNPHKRYLPILYELMVFVHELNYLLTIQTELALMEASGQGMYLDLSRATPETIAAFEGSGFSVEEGPGAGSRRAWVSKAETGTADRLPAYAGEIKPFPSTLSVYLMERVAHLQDIDIPSAMPSRFLVGNVGESETAGSPASSLAMQTQAASIPRDKHLSPQDEFWEDVGWRIISLIKNTDKDVAPALQKKYPIAATGEEGPSVEAGDQIVLTANDLKPRMDIHVFTKRELLQEEMQIWARADADIERGRITLEEYYEKRGYTDPLQHIEDLNLERHRAATAEQFAADEAEERRNLHMLIAGIAPPLQPPNTPTPGAGAIGPGPAIGPEGVPGPGNPGAGAPPIAGGGGPPLPQGGPGGPPATTVPQPRPAIAAPETSGSGVGGPSFQ